jgi:hypothetical protein
MFASNAAHALCREIVDPQAHQTDLAVGNPAGRIDKTDDSARYCGFARAGFAHDAEYLARFYVE